MTGLVEPKAGEAPPRAKAGTVASGAPNAAATLLKLEGDLRQVRTPAEFAYFLANEPRVLTRAQQIAVFRRSLGGQLTVEAVSALTHVDRSAPLVVWFEKLIERLAATSGIAEPRELDADAYASPGDTIAGSYPLRYLLWLPFRDLDGAVTGGMLQARATPWSEHDIAIGRHFADAAAMVSMAFERRRAGFALPFRLSRRWALGVAAALLALLLVPVPMSALAPVEVAPRDAFLVTAGVDGVVEDVLVPPSAAVTKGQPLIRLSDTVLANRLEIAEREVAVAEARLKKASQLAFVDMRGRHELGLAQAELALKSAERDYARDLLARSEIRAERDGVAIYSDKKDLIGRPVATGEKLMEIADPKSSELRIDLPVGDAIVIEVGARIKVFLDTAPLSPIEARLVRADYQARPHDNQQLAFRLVAETADHSPPALRLGARGTAKVTSGVAPLGFYLLRRPIAALRQWVGY